MIRIAKRVCIDCGTRLKNRSKSTIRCRACHVIQRNKNAKGRVIGVFCKKCGKELSLKKTSSFLCRKCYLKNPTIPWNKGTKGLCMAWNKGKTKFNSKEEYKIHNNRLRRLRYYKLSAKEKIADNIRTLIRNSLRVKRNLSKKSKTVKLLGCNINEFIKHLESLFADGMSWENYGNGHGKWNIDHIRPINSFKKLNLLYEQKQAFNFLNCRPLWASDNIRKRDKWENTF